MRILITCPPMLGRIDQYRHLFEAKNIELVTPKVVQTLTESELISIVPEVDGWIIGDDPATANVFNAGKAGQLKAAVKWGVGVDNVDFASCKLLGIPITNTPGMFGQEVADLALAYLIGLARDTYFIDRKVREGQWVKPAGISLNGRHVALIGYGDIGQAVAQRLASFGLSYTVYDPFADQQKHPDIQFATLPQDIDQADFIVVTCALTPSSRHLVNDQLLQLTKPGVRIVNVSRGPIIDETALLAALDRKHVYAAALDVFETEPLPMDSGLRLHERCIFGTHNGSNTIQAVDRTSHTAIKYLFEFLGV